MPITSVDIDSDLLRRAKDAFGVKTTREAISLALSDAVMRRSQWDAIQTIASIPLDTNACRVSYDA